jgi:hypothetical protein
LAFITAVFEYPRGIEKVKGVSAGVDVTGSGDKKTGLPK